MSCLISPEFLTRVGGVDASLKNRRDLSPKYSQANVALDTALTVAKDQAL